MMEFRARSQPAPVTLYKVRLLVRIRGMTV